jgi:hypothetical protein
MDAPNMYKYMEAEIRQKYPQWFEGEEEEAVDDDTLPVTRGEFKEAVADISGKIELTYPTLGTIQSSGSVISNRPGTELPFLPSGAYPDTILNNPRVSRKRPPNQSLGVVRIVLGRNSVEVRKNI